MHVHERAIHLRVPVWGFENMVTLVYVVIVVKVHVLVVVIVQLLLINNDKIINIPSEMLGVFAACCVHVSYPLAFSH